MGINAPNDPTWSDPVNYLIARLSEPSTHAGLAAIAAGVALIAPAGPVKDIALAVCTALGGYAAVKADPKPQA